MTELHLLVVRHQAAPEEIAKHTPGHIAYLDRYHASGVFLVSGQTLREEEGGAIVAAGVDRAEIERIAAEDPFLSNRVSTYEITTITVRRSHEQLTGLVGGRTAGPAPVEA
ncbi:hypothetical protein FXN61_19140 [Lentzea sp. PSKA42]|uniref:YCII-related domain-containing protein n=1 Tax=Lentzea indica TaxID=2604800 RepID=A0ABX1FJB4_9PSEU|nr:YciI family protein [Lentzea indica]NKE58811.1 hypothetical protein [Lentzea indica]